jgi:hypothetical protein
MFAGGTRRTPEIRKQIVADLLKHDGTSLG